MEAIKLKLDYDLSEVDPRKIVKLTIRNPIGLIGDCLGTFPVLQWLNELVDLRVIPCEEVRHLYSLVPDIKIIQDSGQFDVAKFDVELDLSLAFSKKIYMSAAHYIAMGNLGIKCNGVWEPRAKLTVVPDFVHEYDYILAPFSRSLPANQKWPIERWMDLCRSMPDKRFAMFGSSIHDVHPQNTPDNLQILFGLRWNTVCNLMLRAKQGVVSVVTGISHLAFHLGVKNYLLTNQGTNNWGCHPDAIAIEKYIPTLEVEELKCFLQSN